MTGQPKARLEMNTRIKQLLAGTVIAGAALIVTASPAFASKVEWGGPIDKPHVTCTSISIDPPPNAWVHLVGDIIGHDAAGNPVEFHLGEYGVAYGNNTFFPKSFNLLDSLYGKVEYELAATWSLGKGYSQASGGYITCHDAPAPKPTTTTTVPKRTVAPPTTTIRMIPPAVVTATPPAQELPHTGSSTVPIAVAGFGLLGLGSLALALGRKASA